MKLRSQSARTLLYEEVVEELYRLIDEKHIQPGGKLPPERELIEQLKVSRNVLREAFHVLETRGVIVSHQGKGRFLREQPGHGSEKRTESLSKNLERYSMLEAYEVRQVLEVKGVELIIRNASEEDIDDLEKAYKKVEHTYETTGTTTGEFELHKLYAEKTGSMFMTQTLELVLNAILNQRSQDVLAANNWNVVQYSVLMHMLAQVCDMQVGELVHVIADAHIYDRHIPLIEELISRETHPAPIFKLNPDIKNFYDFTTKDITIENYVTGPQIKNIPIAV